MGNKANNSNSANNGGRKTGPNPTVEELKQKAADAAAGAKGGGCGGGGPAQGGSRPVILMKGGAVRSAVEDAEKALVQDPIPSVFQRGGRLVRAGQLKGRTAGGDIVFIPGPVELTPAGIRDEMARVADFLRWDVRKDAWVPGHPTGLIADTLMSRVGRWSFDALLSVINCPTLRSDLSILDRPGFDRQTGIYLMASSIQLPAAVHSPTRADAEQALGLLKELVSEAAFDTAASRSVVLSGMISATIRAALDTVPLHAISGPKAGTGKSYLVDMIATLVTGESAVVVPAGGTLEETVKRLDTALIEGRLIVSLDNLNGVLKSDTLCTALTQDMLQVRVLGASRTVTVPNAAVFFATGNNLTVGGDLPRRTVLAYLDTGLERPETRVFASDPKARVKADRGAYIGAIMTIIRWYHRAGRPNAVGLPGFDAWSTLVRSALIELGEADPCDSMRELSVEEPDTADVRAFIEAWRAADPAVGQPKLVKEIVEIASTSDPQGGLCWPELHDVLVAVAGEVRGGRTIDPHRLGGWLRDHHRQTVGGWRIEKSARLARAGVAKWFLARPGAEEAERAQGNEDEDLFS